jgi:hypothetical protein
MSGDNKSILERAIERTGAIERETLRPMLDEAKAFAASRTVKTEEGRTLIAFHIRLLETLIDGKPSTAMPSRHHV